MCTCNEFFCYVIHKLVLECSFVRVPEAYNTYFCVIFVSPDCVCVLCRVGVQPTVNPYFTRIVKEVKHMIVQ